MGVGLLLVGKVRAEPVSYTYDALGRVATVTYPNGTTTTYTYDAADNRTQRTTGGAPPPPPPPPLSVALSGTEWNGAPDGREDPPLNVVATGGVPPYAYLWFRVSGNTATKPRTPTAAECSWIYEGPLIGPAKISYWRCNVTDQTSAVVSTALITVRMEMS